MNDLFKTTPRALFVVTVFQFTVLFVVDLVASDEATVTAMFVCIAVQMAVLTVATWNRRI